MARTQMLFTCSEEFKTNVEKYATQKDMSASALIRLAVANMIGYDISKETQTDGRRKYENDEERKQANADKIKNKRKMERLLIEAYEHEEHIRAIFALESSLK